MSTPLKQLHYQALGPVLDIIVAEEAQKQSTGASWADFWKAEVQPEDPAMKPYMDAWSGHLNALYYRPKAVRDKVEGHGYIQERNGTWRPRRSGKGQNKELIARWLAQPRLPTLEGFVRKLRNLGWNGGEFIAGNAMYQPAYYEKIGEHYVVHVNLPPEGKTSMGPQWIQPADLPGCEKLLGSQVEMLREAVAS